MYANQKPTFQVEWTYPEIEIFLSRNLNRL